MNDLKRKAKTRLIISAVILALTAACLAGVTVARIRQTAGTQNMTLKYSFSSDSVHILKAGAGGAPVESGGAYAAPDGWSSVSKDKKAYTLSFLLSNSASPSGEADFDQNCRIEVFVTDGAPAALTVKLAVRGVELNGTPETVSEGSVYFESYGAGRVYRFVNGSGETYTWDLPGGDEAFVPMTLSVTGEGVDPAALTVVAGGIPTDNH